MNVLNPLGFLAEIKCGISLTSVSLIWGVGRLTFLDAGQELDLKGLSFNFFSPPVLCDPARRYCGEQGLLRLPGRGGEDEDSIGGCAGYLENDENSTCEMWLGADLCA